MKNVHDYNIVGQTLSLEIISNCFNSVPLINPYKLFDKPDIKVKKLIETVSY